MKLVSTSECALRPVGSPFSDAMPRSEVVLNGQPTGVIIDGAVLEVVIRWRDLLLFFVTDNIMHEETLRIYLFDAKLTAIDSAKLGWMYATGIFTLLGLSAPNKIRFRFFGDTDWTLELFSADVFAIPFLNDPRGVSKPFRFHRRFQISGNPKPDAPQKNAPNQRKLPQHPLDSTDL